MFNSAVAHKKQQQRQFESHENNTDEDDDRKDKSTFLDDNGNLSHNGEECDLGDTSRFTAEERESLYLRGLEYERSFRFHSALRCYLSCLRGLTNSTCFLHLPDCINKIAKLYTNIDCRENDGFTSHLAGVDTEDMQSWIDCKHQEKKDESSDFTEHINSSAQAEDLLRLCRSERHPADHSSDSLQSGNSSINDETPEKFSTLSEVSTQGNRRQFSDCESSGQEQCRQEEQKTSSTINKTSLAVKAPTSILRQRSIDPSKEAEREKKQVRFHESVENNLRLKEKERVTSKAAAWIQLVLSVLMMTTLVLTLCCCLDTKRPGGLGQSLTGLGRSWLHVIRHYYHQWLH